LAQAFEQMIADAQCIGDGSQRRIDYPDADKEAVSTTYKLSTSCAVQFTSTTEGFGIRAETTRAPVMVHPRERNSFAEVHLIGDEMRPPPDELPLRPFPHLPVGRPALFAGGLGGRRPDLVARRIVVIPVDPRNVGLIEQLGPAVLG